MKAFDVEETKRSKPAPIKIAVVGVGGGGSNMVEHLVKNTDTKDIQCIVVNTDKQALDNVEDESIQKIQIGEKLTKGLG